MRTVIGSAILSAVAVSAWGQGAPGTNLSVDARVLRIMLRGDTAVVEHLLTNSSTSQEELFGFTVEAPAPVTRINLPEPAAQWETGIIVKGLSVASWGMLGRHLARGATSPSLVFEAIGLPTIVTYWAEGWFPIPEYEPIEPGPPPPPREALSETAVTGKTVGVEPFPADLTPFSLISRLQGLTGLTCGELAWITSGNVCSSLGTKLEQAGQAAAQGNNGAARAEVESYLAELATQHDTTGTLPVSDNAYWLLKVNAEFILSRVPQR